MLKQFREDIHDPWFLLGWAEGASLGYLIGFAVAWGIFMFSGYDRKWLGFVVLTFIGWFVMNACRRYQRRKLGLDR